MSIPNIIWAQRKDRLFLTVQLNDISDEKIELSDSKLVFSGLGGPDHKSYAFDLEFFEEIESGKSNWKVKPRNLQFILLKKNDKAPFWPRLTKIKGKFFWIKADWNLWVDEDEEKKTPPKGFDWDPESVESSESEDNLDDLDEQDHDIQIPQEENLEDIEKLKVELDDDQEQKEPIEKVEIDNDDLD
eukprot:Anaeramoba_ignava/a354405_75.p1 GENE.a354405_75~~a354405_75.p1  ORF type:complete len:187 (+),score=88.63 a354405_75:22-582(+)